MCGETVAMTLLWLCKLVIRKYVKFSHYGVFILQRRLVLISPGASIGFADPANCGL